MREKFLIIIISLFTGILMFYKFSIYLKNTQLSKQILEQKFLVLIDHILQLNKTFENIPHITPFNYTQSVMLYIIAFVIIISFFFIFNT